MKKSLILLPLFFSLSVFAEDIQQQIDSFGGNESLYLKAKVVAVFATRFAIIDI